MFMYIHGIYRDLSVNRLLMRCAVLRNKIMAFVCVGEIYTNVFAHIFPEGPWMVDARVGGGRNISGLRTCTDAHLRMRH